jgi:hypothetical protein
MEGEFQPLGPTSLTVEHAYRFGRALVAAAAVLTPPS